MRNPVKTAKRQLLRVGSCALSALMVLGSIPAAAIGDGVTATYDEAYYAMTDYYGNLTDGSVVKSYRTNGIATLTDYGDYDEIINLTDGTMPARNGGIGPGAGIAAGAAGGGAAGRAGRNTRRCA